jgi:dTDP-4-dehydrorhamnose reductase
MKILITGAKGQLGNEIKTISENYTLDFDFTDIEELNLTNLDEVKSYISRTHPDYVVNCAAYTAVDNAESNAADAELINARVPENLSILARELKFKLIHISTDYVFSGKGYIPWNEDDQPMPESVYGATKRLGELLVQKNSKSIIIRTSWLYSIFGNNFVKSMMKLGNERESLGVVYDQTGSPTNAADLAKTVMDVISYSEKTKTWRAGIYHYSNEGVTSWYDFAVEIMDLAQIQCKISPILSKDYPLPAPRPNYSVMNKYKIRHTFEIDIPYWKESLKKAIKQLKTKNNN